MSQPSTTAPAARLPVTFPLRDLGVAPENLRFEEPPDAEVPQLAESILAAGLLQPLTVRRGRRREKPAMVLDGRRRWLALIALLADGRIADDYPVSAFVETEPARQAAAVVLTNTGVPVHVADVIAAIGKMLKAKLTPEAIARALGYTDLEVRRLAALAGLHPKALEALKAGKITLRHARLLARLPDRKEQQELAESALAGHGFAEWRVTERLDRGQLTAADRRFLLVGPARYAEAGGRTEGDLFGERPDVLLDPPALQTAWTARAEAIAGPLAAPDLALRIEAAPGPVDDGLEMFGCAYGVDLDPDAVAAWRAAQTAAADAEAKLADRDLSDAASDAEILGYLQARLAADVAGEPPRPLTLLQVFASSRTGLDLRAYGPAVEAEATGDDPAAEDEPGGGDEEAPAAAVNAAPLQALAEPPAAADGAIGHALHQVRTDTATRALIRALADRPAAALVVVVARLFDAVVLQRLTGRGASASTLQASAYGRPGVPPMPELDGCVRQRLADRRAAWAASGLTPIAWVAGLTDEDRLGLLAELAALSLDLREERATAVRRTARAEAAEIAVLCEADVTRHWTPDEAFLGAHPRSQLLAMLEAMGAVDAAAASARKTELVALVAERARERRWAPPWLSWAAPPPEQPRPDDEPHAAPDSEAPPLAA